MTIDEKSRSHDNFRKIAIRESREGGGGSLLSESLDIHPVFQPESTKLGATTFLETKERDRAVDVPVSTQLFCQVQIGIITRQNTAKRPQNFDRRHESHRVPVCLFPYNSWDDKNVLYLILAQ